MRIAIFGKSYASGKQDEINTLFSSLQKYSPELLVDREFLRVMQDMDIRLPEITVLSGNDFYADISLSLGGDGTFLKTAERIGDKCIPILGINLGRMGFLADVQSSETEQAIDEIMAGRYHIEERSLLHIRIDRIFPECRRSHSCPQSVQFHYHACRTAQPQCAPARYRRRCRNQARRRRQKQTLSGQSRWTFRRKDFGRKHYIAQSAVPHTGYQT